jgi:hypothetical protein
MADELGLKLRAAIALTKRAVAIINKVEDWDITPKDLPDIILKLVESELDDG